MDSRVHLACPDQTAMNGYGFKQRDYNTHDGYASYDQFVLATAHGSSRRDENHWWTWSGTNVPKKNGTCADKRYSYNPYPDYIVFRHEHAGQTIEKNLYCEDFPLAAEY